MNDDEIIRNMIQQENSLISSRMGWMLTLQGLLFGALGFVLKEPLIPNYYIVMISLTGIAISVLTAWGLNNATRAIIILMKTWEGNPKASRARPVIGLYNNKTLFSYLTPWLILSLIFIVPWTFLLFEIF